MIIHTLRVLLKVKMKNNTIQKLSFTLALEVIETYKYLSYHKKEYVLSKQLLRSGTSIGANISESQNAQSLKDFISKISISLKETGETIYWVELLVESNYLDESRKNKLLEFLIQLKLLLGKIISTSKKKLSKQN